MTMQTNLAQTTQSFMAEPAETSFASVWGNAMQREDFLALAAGVRQFSLGMADLALVSSTPHYASEQAQLAAE